MDDILEITFFIGLIGHGLAHAVATINLVREIGGNVRDGVLATRSWLLPNLSNAGSATLAMAFWLPASVGFLVAAVSMQGIVLGTWPWSAIMVAAALISSAGVVLFSARWPGGEPRLRPLHIFLALGMNAIILVTQLLGWPASS